MMIPSVLRKSAADVLKEHWDGNLPVRPSEIARAQGIVVLESPMLKESGRIQREADGRVFIMVNSNESELRNRFTIAHELGHFNLGHLTGSAMCRDFPESYGANTQKPEEREANDFAANLLMPADAVRFVIERGYAKSVDDLRMMFRVSEVAMRFRLMNLGLL